MEDINKIRTKKYSGHSKCKKIHTIPYI